MRIKIRHETRYQYSAPQKRVIQTLRLTPRDNASQYVASWRIEIDPPVRLTQAEDAFGNITHTFSAEDVEALTVVAEGEVETQDSNGIMSGASARFPPMLYLRETDLTRADTAIRAFATEVAGESNGDRLALLHALMSAIHRSVVFDTDPTHVNTTAAESYAMRRGVCQDLTHIFLAAARHLGIPARYVSGYFRRVDGVVEQEAGHAWAEAHVDELGWVGFDPANGISTTDAHVRVAIGLDYLNAAPVRGSRYGAGEEELTVALTVEGG